jgi:Ca2+-binding RTX toxin-like protein
MTGVTVLPGAKLSYAAAGGSSADVLAVGMDDPTIGPGGTVAVSLLGGGGDDDLAALVRGTAGGGALDVVADGGDGNDQVSVMVELPPDPFRAALKRVSVLVLGGAGNDLLYLAVLPDDVQRGYLVAKLDGGAGFDTCSATRDVEVLNCEDHVVLSGGGGQ